MECSSALFLFVAVLGLGVWLRRITVRTGFAEARLRDLEAEVDGLRRTVDDGVVGPASEEAGPAPQSGRDARAPSEVEPEREWLPVPEVEPAPLREVESAPEPADEEPPLPARPPAPEPASPLRRIDWERWLGVRGAAVLGAAALALAGFLFLRVAIERGFFPPPVRVTLGMLAGLAAIVGSEGLRRRPGRYDATANALAGAGVVLLYAAVWAAGALYELVATSLAFALMAAVTAACGALSWRHGSLVIAVLGLAGGFATPALLSTGVDRPFVLFGYLLLLDAGLLVLAVRRGWPVLAALSLGLTGLYQVSWIVGRMGAQRALLGLAILGLFAAVFAVAGRTAGREMAAKQGGAWLAAQAGAVLLPFAFAFHFAGWADLGPRVLPLAGLLLLLSLLALWLDRGLEQRFLGLAAAAADVAVVAVWSTAAPLDAAPAWQLVAGVLALAFGFQLFFELEASTGRREWASLLAAAGFLLLLVLLRRDFGGDGFRPWLVGCVALAALLWRQGGWPGRGARRLVAALGLGLAFGLYALAHEGAWPAPFAALTAAVMLQVLALAERGTEARGVPFLRSADAAAAALPLTVLVLLLGAVARPAWAGSVLPLVCLVLGALAALAATRLPSGGVYAAAVGATALAHGLWSDAAPDPSAGLALLALAVLLFTTWPFVAAATGASAGFTASPWTWRAAALAAPAWFLPLKELFERRFGDGFIGLLPVALGFLSLAAALRASRLPGDDALRLGRLAWFAAAALGFAAVAVPLQLEEEWVTLGWALQGLAVAALWRRLAHPGLKHFALGLLAAATARLVVEPALFGFEPRGGLPVLNWLLTTYLVPAAALVGTAAILRPVEVARHRPWERRLFGSRPAGAVACGLAAILVVFVWINLTILDAFATDDRLTASFERLPARDLTTSLAWIAYALVLLALGMAGASRGLRWISLGFLVLAIGKVFLYDLGELTDLYRVGSLLGLAVSLILVSLAYQRFVFGRGRAPDEDVMANTGDPEA